VTRKRKPGAGDAGLVSDNTTPQPTQSPKPKQAAAAPHALVKYAARPVADSDAAEIGNLYRQAHASMVASVQNLIEAGQRLTAKKAELGHGNWIPWLEANADALGFGERTAQLLIKSAAANPKLDFGNLTADKALKLNRQIWGNTEERRAERLARIAAQADAGALPQDRKYPIILADPAWRYEHSPYGTHSRSVEEHYPTMALEDICALPVSQLAADNAMLFLWSPTPMLEQAFTVIRAWGFEFRTAFVWVKPTGTGLYLRQRHEHLLVARRGEFPTPDPANRPDSVIEAPRREHSRKPDEAAALIERMYPGLARIELFARQARPGWDRWGAEAPADMGAAA
jgi:N6-adenosine-specific RNA methylase IME4